MIHFVTNEKYIFRNSGAPLKKIFSRSIVPKVKSKLEAGKINKKLTVGEKWQKKENKISLLSREVKKPSDQFGSLRASEKCFVELKSEKLILFSFRLMTCYSTPK